MKPVSPRAPTAATAANSILESLRGATTTVELLVVSDSEDRGVGKRMLVREAATEGSLGDSELDEAVRTVGERELREPSRGSFLHSIEVGSGRHVGVYVESHRPRQELVIVGAGHIAQPLAAVGTLLGFEVTVLDDRPEFATRERFPKAAGVWTADFSDPLADVDVHAGSHIVLVTRGHKYDFECLRRLLVGDATPAYIGMIGSRRRVRATFVQLAAEDIPEERIATVRAPVGLDIGAQTPAEIAVSVAAEMILLRRGGKGLPLCEMERVVERFLTTPEETPAASEGPTPHEDLTPLEGPTSPEEAPTASEGRTPVDGRSDFEPAG